MDKLNSYGKNLINLHNNFTFIIWLIIIITILTFFRNTAYYNTKKVSDTIEITNLGKTIHLQLKKCLKYGKDKDTCIKDLDNDLNNHIKPYAIVRISNEHKELINYDLTKYRHLNRGLVILPQYLTQIEGYNYNLYVAKHSTPSSIPTTVFRSLTFSITDFYSKAKESSIKEAVHWYKRNQIILRSKGVLIYALLTFLGLFFIRKWQKKPKRKTPDTHNPQKLVQLLSNFTRDTPMKYTTHTWDFGSIQKTYTNYAGFINSVKEQWKGMGKELKELSPNLHHKIYSFIFASKAENDWMINKDTSIGWSTLEGFEEWCNEGNDPFAFKLKKSYLINGKELSKFGDIVNLFKQEIEIRKEYHMLENIFMDIEESLDEKYYIEDSKLHGKNFYTDVETFKYALNKIFSEIQKRDFYKILVEATDTTGEYIDITITQVGSKAQSTVSKMLYEINDGDFEDIKQNLTNLCDWSIESHFEDGNYRINYLRSDANTPEIEVLNTEPKGFTHKLRFYR